MIVETYHAVKSGKSPHPSAQAEEQITERMRSRRRPGRDDAARSPVEEQTLIDVIVAREIARVDMGIDLLVAQPR